ncbi:Uma2 family endonuclease [Pendulispora albinea]|uniref:Uma2 family endonuclease n=1 Tax=Pendulispora albinea TaxID=2741071 RepID=A0ABZ2LKJ4_9BACT
MANAVTPSYVTLEAFWEAEETSESRHEWLDGVVYDMSRGTIEHARLIGSIVRILGNALLDECSVYSSEVMLYIAETKLATYADATVVCGPLATYRVAKLGEAITNPTLLVEVLSDRTEGYDRGEKFAYYMRISSLKEYVLVSQYERRIEVFRRPQRGRWIHEVAQAGQSLTLHGHAIEVDAVYAKPVR